MGFITIYVLQFDNSAFLTKLYIIVHLLVIPSEKTQYPAEVRAPVAVAKLGIPISGTRPEFGKQILQERQPLMYTHADDDWFVLLEVAPKVSGICLYSPACIFFLQLVVFASRFCSLLKGYAKVIYMAQCVCRWRHTFILSPWPRKLFILWLEALY